MSALVKKENDSVSVSNNDTNVVASSPIPGMVIILSSSDSSSDSDSDSDSDSEPGIRSSNLELVLGKRPRHVADAGLEKRSKGDVVLPGVLSEKAGSSGFKASKQFWKAGDYEGDSGSVDARVSSGGIDHVRVHPKFLHSNATSHKWALGAFAELLDNSLDEVCNGATFVNIDVVDNRKDRSKMLLIEDDGGGMDPDKIRQCMSLGYSVKSKVANTIGQYGNGFKTSTMRLGADVIVFSRSCGKDGKRPTQSIGLLSYTFLRSTKQTDIIVPMLDYEGTGGQWEKILRSNSNDWDKNLETIKEWSPFSSEVDLLRQFNLMKMQGTRIIIYNLWEDDEGQLELDFDADAHDIQLRGVNREDKHIQMAKSFPNSRHFLTYRHSLRSYASILYLRLPPGFRAIIRGCDVEHHNVVNDMMLSQKITYRPLTCPDGFSKDSMTAVVTIGFVKDAKHHIDVQGFNVYHKNRLIKPFWRLWNVAGSEGRGVIGVLEANFVEPAHDKQGFERTTVLARLEAKLIQMQKNYWRGNCHLIGYAPRSNKTSDNSFAYKEDSPDYSPRDPQSKKKYSASGSKTSSLYSDKCKSRSTQKEGLLSIKQRKSTSTRSGMAKRSPVAEESSDSDLQITPVTNGDSVRMPGKIPLLQDSASGESAAGTPGKMPLLQDSASDERAAGSSTKLLLKGNNNSSIDCVNSGINDVEKLIMENSELRNRLEKKEEEIHSGLLKDLLCERDRCKELETQLQEAQQNIEELNKEQEKLIDIFSEERLRRHKEEESLRKKLKEASGMIQDLRDKIKILEKNKG